MTGETGQLQQLTDEQVSARLASYNAGGSLDRDVQLLRETIADLLAEEVLAKFGPERAERYARIYAGKVDASWVQGVAEYGREIYRDKIAVPAYIADRMTTADRVVPRIVERFAGDPSKLSACICAFISWRTSPWMPALLPARIANGRRCARCVWPVRPMWATAITVRITNSLVKLTRLRRFL